MVHLLSQVSCGGNKASEKELVVFDVKQDISLWLFFWSTAKITVYSRKQPLYMISHKPFLCMTESTISF